jgi:hypothetical protein
LRCDAIRRWEVAFGAAMLGSEVSKMLGGMYPYTYSTPWHVGSGGSWWVPLLIIAVTLVAFGVYVWRAWWSGRKEAAAHRVTSLPSADDDVPALCQRMRPPGLTRGSFLGSTAQDSVGLLSS